MSEKTEKDWFVTERTRALAVTYLTRRKDLILREEKGGELGLDFIVQIVKDEFATLRIFGIELRGTPAAVSNHHANQVLKPALQQYLRVEEFYFPVCLLYFTMQDNKGRYTWIAEPVITQDGKPKLERRAEAECQILDNDSLAAIVAQVDQWYEALGNELHVA